VSEAGGVEVQAEAALPRPRDPALEVARFQRVAVDAGGVGVGVAGVQVEAL
jgi:hypothetical protein